MAGIQTSRVCCCGFWKNIVFVRQIANGCWPPLFCPTTLTIASLHGCILQHLVRTCWGCSIIKTVEVLVVGLAAPHRCFTQQSAQTPHMEPTSGGSNIQICQICCLYIQFRLTSFGFKSANDKYSSETTFCFFVSYLQNNVPAVSKEYPILLS